MGRIKIGFFLLILAMTFDELLASPDARNTLADGYSVMFARGQPVRACNSSLGGYFARFKRDARAARTADAILSRTCAPNWVGLKLKRGEDFDATTITDARAAAALAAGRLDPADFDVLPIDPDAHTQEALDAPTAPVAPNKPKAKKIANET